MEKSRRPLFGLRDEWYRWRLVMGSVQRTGVGGLFIGDTAELVLRQVQCAVLTIKPEGFVSPVLPDWEGSPAAVNSERAPEHV